MTFQTNSGLGSVEATGWWASWCPDMELEKIGLKPVSLFLGFLIYGIIFNFEKNVFLILESNSSESIGRGSINSLTLISPFLQLLLVAKIILNKLVVQLAVHNFIMILILIII